MIPRIAWIVGAFAFLVGATYGEAAPKAIPAKTVKVAQAPSPAEAANPVANPSKAKVRAPRTAPGQPDLQAEVSAAETRMAQLEAQRAAAMKTARSRLPLYASGVGLMKYYDKLLKVRYIDDEGVFLPEAELTARDVENLNKLTQVYLRSRPFASRTSARTAREEIERARRALEEKVAASEKPSEDNDSEVAIFSDAIRIETERLETLAAQAEQGGQKLQRRPASN